MTTEQSRRKFIQKGTAATVATSYFVGASAAEAAPNKIRLGIIGCGGIMGHHVRGLCSRKSPVEFRWLCDVDPRQMRKFEQVINQFQTGAPKQTGKYEDVLNDSKVDAVSLGINEGIPERYKRRRQR